MWTCDHFLQRGAFWREAAAQPSAVATQPSELLALLGHPSAQHLILDVVDLFVDLLHQFVQRLHAQAEELRQEVDPALRAQAAADRGAQVVAVLSG